VRDLEKHAVELASVGKGAALAIKRLEIVEVIVVHAFVGFQPDQSARLQLELPAYLLGPVCDACAVVV